MDIKTHTNADKSLLGTPVEVRTGEYAKVELMTSENMGVDEKGLVHGGFAFGLADYAAMLAVNDPYVVLGGADVRFTAPVKVGEIMVATATLESEEKRKRIVSTEISVNEQTVFKGTFTCFVLDKHVFET